MTTAYKQHTTHCPCEALNKKHFADVQRLEADAKRSSEMWDAERVGWREEYEQTKAQRDEAVGRFILSVNAEAEADMARGNPLEGAHHRALEKLGAPFLATLSTVTESDWPGHQRDLAQPGKTEAELRAKYGLCERVSVCCAAPKLETPLGKWCSKCKNHAGYECIIHEGEWPGKGGCPAEEKVG